MGLTEWAVYGGTLTAKIGVKMALNACVPGSGSLIEFGHAWKNFYYDGDVLGAVINTISGAADLVTLGLASTAKEAMRESAKAAVVQSAKDSAKAAGKEATRKVGQDLAKQMAMGTTTVGRDAAIKTAKAAAALAYKEATRKVGQQVGKEIAKGVTTVAAEEVFTKMTFNKLLQSLQSTASAAVLEELYEFWITEALKQQPKDFAFELTKNAAIKGAEEELKKHSSKLFVKDLVFSVLKEAIRFDKNE